LIGVLPNRTISGIKILSISDTSGFGQNALKPEFYTQFAGKSIDDKFSAHEDIDGLSGATITRQGIGNILKVATQEAIKYLDSDHKEDSK
jgi:electron transport complex protein RnfG